MSLISISPQDLGVIDEADLLHLAELFKRLGERAFHSEIVYGEHTVRFITEIGTLTVDAHSNGLDVSSNQFPRLTMEACPICSSMKTYAGADYWHCGNCGMHNSRNKPPQSLFTVKP